MGSYDIDIINRLRNRLRNPMRRAGRDIDVMLEAAWEIEKLRKEVESLRSKCNHYLADAIRHQEDHQYSQPEWTGKGDMGM